MKRFFAVLLTAVLLLCGCSGQEYEVSFNNGYTELYYNGRTYVKYPNTNGKYRIDFTDEGCVELDREPYGILYLLGAETVYYGNETENPSFIATPRGSGFYVREDLTIDHDTLLTVQGIEEDYSFTIAEVTEGEGVLFEESEQNVEKCNFFVRVEPYTAVQLWLEVWDIGGMLYLRDAWDSEFYLMTEEFTRDLHRLELYIRNYKVYSYPEKVAPEEETTQP